MEEPDILVYISDYNKECEKVIQNLKKWKIPYETKNINENNHMKELQDKGIYGIPAMYSLGLLNNSCFLLQLIL
ncbi:hypothetical protein [Virgibacillus proomii]|uniref:hypothetical protein n=1 Tax=Virgibacillus proomii TaxID=84407 RepID=UPI001C12723A|nr:hypothetical protein [Virgibacillus proomii]MBU5268139.1 hypothetical protein [Virgibacillus proomii]